MIIKTANIISASIGDTWKMCSTEISTENKTSTAEGVNAHIKDSAKTIGADFNLLSYPILLLIICNITLAILNYTIGSI